MACEQPDLKQKLYRYVRGELEDAAEREAVDAHLQACAECGAIQRELHWLLGTMRRPGVPGWEHEVRRQLGARAGTAAESGPPPDPEPAPQPPAPPRAGWLRRLLRLWLSTGGRRLP